MRKFFELGGDYEPSHAEAASEANPPSAAPIPDPSLLSSAPVHTLAAVPLGRSMLLAVASRDEAALARVAHELARAGCARVRFGGSEHTWPAVAHEAARALAASALRPCASPSGAHRDDTCVLVHDHSKLCGGALAWPALHALSDAIGEVLHALCGFLAECLGLVATARSDAILAHFAPGASGYGDHLDSCYDRPDAAAPRRISAVLYLNDGWRAEHGGGLRLWSERERCWHEVVPLADELVLLRADRTRHMVAAVSRDAPAAGRLAMTVFLYGRYATGRG